MHQFVVVPSRPSPISSASSHYHDVMIRMGYYLLLDGMTKSKKSSSSLAKWNLLNAVNDLKSKELKRYLASTSNSDNTSRDGMRGGKGRGRGGEEGDCVMQNTGRTGSTPLVRRVVYTAVLTMLSAYSILQAIQAAESNRVDFNKIFDNIVVADCSAWTSKALYYFRNVNGFQSVSVFLCGVISQLGFLIRQMKEFFMDFGLSDSELPPVFTLLRPSLHDSSMSSAEVLSADMGFQAQQVLLFLVMALGPFLLWTWSFSSSSRALSAVSDMVAVSDALHDPSYDSLFQLALYRHSDSSGNNDRYRVYLKWLVTVLCLLDCNLIKESPPVISLPLPFYQFSLLFLLFFRLSSPLLSSPLLSSSLLFSTPNPHHSPLYIAIAPTQ